MLTAELKSHFLRLYQMAFTDDNFDVLELKMLYKFAEERGVSRQQLDEVLTNPSHISEIPEDIEKRVEYLYDLAVMIWADGIVTEEESATLRKYCLRFEFLEENVNSITEYLLEQARNNVPKSEIINQLKE